MGGLLFANVAAGAGCGAEREIDDLVNDRQRVYDLLWAEFQNISRGLDLSM
jgi:hypothetical protein